MHRNGGDSGEFLGFSVGRRGVPGSMFRLRTARESMLSQAAPELSDDEVSQVCRLAHGPPSNSRIQRPV